MSRKPPTIASGGAARQLTEVVAAVAGGTVADHVLALHEARPTWQKLNQIETMNRAREELRRRGVDEQAAAETQPEHVVEILEAAANKTNPNIKEMFARLLATVMDRNRAGQYRSEFVTLIGKFEPLDAALIMAVADAPHQQPTQRANFARRFEVSEDQIELAFRNLIRLECARSTAHTETTAVMNAIENIALLPLGRELARTQR
jgi:hypothetical protein